MRRTYCVLIEKTKNFEIKRNYFHERNLQNKVHIKSVQENNKLLVKMGN